jgi:hypothetical protein
VVRAYTNPLGVWRKPKKRKFTDPENTAVVTTKKIIDGTANITLVSHDAKDGGWQFLENDLLPEEENAAVVGLKDIVALDGSVEELADLPRGWVAKRDSIGSAWQRMKANS